MRARWLVRAPLNTPLARRTQTACRWQSARRPAIQTAQTTGCASLNAAWPMGEVQPPFTRLRNAPIALLAQWIANHSPTTVCKQRDRSSGYDPDHHLLYGSGLGL